ncbi:SDR family oxidoreductase [Chryseobacterium potabilaquae]|uniref:UDP-glucose 4-epimerase n=1 Tax=Chryseobacterium potabilaquae TaxID=2675057 RepID=A0A6N4X4R1_9FLAO|nr:aldehyde reductase [Chryseobacterium potabilaquae]CAA7195985.1 UDP-glucose 4-epimerase [Chryseobacterium potabilaquae]
MKNLQTKTTVLVTGGTGFLGVHTILQLLQQGFEVKTTLRSLAKKDSIIKALEKEGITDFSSLSFIEADLMSDNNWDQAVKDCDYVLHLASPFPAQNPEDENEVIIPARDGALRVLKASRDAGVKRVVLTSSFAAVGYSMNTKDHVFTESDWTDTDTSSNISAYVKSKTIAEKSAWKFIEKEGNGLELTVINPVGIFGPAIGNITSTSLDVGVSSILNGTLNYTPSFTMNIVDVRDVVDLHIKAMLHPKASGERFIAASEGVMSFYDIVELFKKERPQYTKNIQTLEPIGKEFYKKISNEKAKTILQWNPRNHEESLLASIDSLMTNP